MPVQQPTYPSTGSGQTYSRPGSNLGGYTYTAPSAPRTSGSSKVNAAIGAAGAFLGILGGIIQSIESEERRRKAARSSFKSKIQAQERQEYFAFQSKLVLLRDQARINAALHDLEQSEEADRQAKTEVLLAQLDVAGQRLQGIREQLTRAVAQDVNAGAQARGENPFSNSGGKGGVPFVQTENCGGLNPHAQCLSLSDEVAQLACIDRVNVGRIRCGSHNANIFLREDIKQVREGVTGYNEGRERCMSIKEMEITCMDRSGPAQWSCLDFYNKHVAACYQRNAVRDQQYERVVQQQNPGKTYYQSGTANCQMVAELARDCVGRGDAGEAVCQARIDALVAQCRRNNLRYLNQ